MVNKNLPKNAVIIAEVEGYSFVKRDFITTDFRFHARNSSKEIGPYLKQKVGDRPLYLISHGEISPKHYLFPFIPTEPFYTGTFLYETRNPMNKKMYELHAYKITL